MDSWEYQSARDLALDKKARSQSPQREPGLLGVLIGLAWWVMVRAFLKVYHRLRIDWPETMPQDPGFIIVANHASHLDVLCLAASLPLKWNGHVYPIAAGDTFFEKPAAALFATFCLNALPLWRRKASGHALSELRSRLTQGHQVLLIFPEGTRSRDGIMGSFKPGIGRIVAGTATPIIPAYIQRAHRAFPPKASFPKPHGIRVTFGKAMSFEESKDSREGWTDIAAALEASVAALDKRQQPEAERPQFH